MFDNGASSKRIRGKNFGSHTSCGGIIPLAWHYVFSIIRPRYKRMQYHTFLVLHVLIFPMISKYPSHDPNGLFPPYTPAPSVFSRPYSTCATNNGASLPIPPSLWRSGESRYVPRIEYEAQASHNYLPRIFSSIAFPGGGGGMIRKTRSFVGVWLVVLI